MAIITIIGRVGKTGEGEYGPWAVLLETITKKDGDTFDKRYMCSGKDIPPEGTRVVVTGYMRDGVREHEGKHYADIKVSAAQFIPIEQGGAPERAAAAPAVEDDDLPF